MWSGISGIYTVVFKYKGLVSMLLGAECSTNIFRAVHGAAALVIEAEDGRYHIGSALRSFQGGGTLLLISDPARRRRSPGAEACREQQTSGISPAAAVRAGKGRGPALRGKNSGLLGVPGVEAVSRIRGKHFSQFCGRR